MSTKKTNTKIKEVMKKQADAKDTVKKLEELANKSMPSSKPVKEKKRIYKSKKYQSVKDCAVDYIKNKENKEKSNKELAEMVSKEMGTMTTPACIAWYKNALKNKKIK